MARDCNHLTGFSGLPIITGWSLAKSWGTFLHDSKHYQNYPNHFPWVSSLPFSAEIKRRATADRLVPLGWASQDLRRAVEETLAAAAAPLLTSQHRGVPAGTWASFFGLAFFGFLWRKVRTAPLRQEKGEQRCCHLAVALGRGHCPRGQDLLLPLSLPSKLNPSCPKCDTVCFLVCPPASQGNINKFAGSRISWPHFLPVPNSAMVQCAQDTLVSKGWLPLKALVGAAGLRWL